MKTIIQAGGENENSRPYNFIIPKPLMPIGKKAAIELQLQWLRKSGIEDCIISTDYLSHLIEAVCGDGQNFDMNIQYAKHSSSYGTLGSLNHIDSNLTDSILMINADTITDLNLYEFMAFHKANKCPLTVATYEKEIPLNLDFFQCENDRVTAFIQKTSQKFTVSMGIYYIEPEILSYIPKNIPFGFDDLFYTLLEKKIPIAHYLHEGSWVNMGNSSEYNNAQRNSSPQIMH